MIKVEKAKRLFLENLHKKQEDLMTFVNKVNDLIEKEALDGEPAISINKTMFEDYESFNDKTLLGVASYFKANGYDVHIAAKILSTETGDFSIEQVFISWVDVISMFDKDYLKESIKNNN